MSTENWQTSSLTAFIEENSEVKISCRGDARQNHHTGLLFLKEKDLFKSFVYLCSIEPYLIQHGTTLGTQGSVIIIYNTCNHAGST